MPTIEAEITEIELRNVDGKTISLYEIWLTP